MSIKNILIRSIATLRSPRGRDALMFMVFIAISAVLWCVLSLNEEDQRDMRLPLNITHVPDSITLISTGPEALNASVRARGTQLIKMHIGGSPVVNVDFRAYSSQGVLKLSNADLKSLVRTAASGSQAIVVYPDTLSLPYTTHRGYDVPVKVEYKATAAPQAALSGKPKLSTDSVKIFMAPGHELPDGFSFVSTEPIKLMAIDKTTRIRTKLVGPQHSRIIPDSVDVTFDVEPMIFKSRKVVIEPINVPNHIKLITFPAQIDVFFMVPRSAYRKENLQFRVVADYSNINKTEPSHMVKLLLRDVSPQLHNVQLSADSAEYIIERR